MVLARARAQWWIPLELSWQASPQQQLAPPRWARSVDSEAEFVTSHCSLLIPETLLAAGQHCS